MKGSLVVGMVVLSAACSSDKAPPAPAAAPTSAAAPAAAGCPATGLWAECSVIYHLDRAGVAPRQDSSATPSERLKGRPLVVKIGMNAVLEVYLYPDSASRIADEKTLDLAQFVSDTGAQTMRRERTLIESANLLGLLASINSRQRERVSDALTVGPPQPSKP